MKKAIRCAGYALRGAIIALGTMAAFIGMLAVVFYSAELVGGWFELSKDQKSLLMIVFVVCSFGAVIGAAHCHERHRFDATP